MPRDASFSNPGPDKSVEHDHQPLAQQPFAQPYSMDMIPGGYFDRVSVRIIIGFRSLVLFTVQHAVLTRLGSCGDVIV